MSNLAITMSCNVLVDLKGTPLCNNPAHHSRQGGIYDQNQFCQNIFKFISRTIYYRRLRLLKLYMAVTVSIFILYLFFNHGFKNSVQDQISHDALVEVYQDQETFAKSHSRAPSNDLNMEDNKLLITAGLGPMKYRNNVSYTLNMAYFSRAKINVMQVRIREAMLHSWNSYKRYAWGFDMLKPRSREPEHWFNLGLTIIDGADTLIMMGLTNEANLALDWMENQLKFDSTNENSNCFELTIRILAGLLSAYHLTSRDEIKNQAVKMGDILLHCYDTESKVVPYSDIDLGTNHAHPPPWNPHSSLSEISSLQLEFRYLSQITNVPKYEETTFQTNVLLHNLTAARPLKLLPAYINPSTKQLEDSIITLGARADSYYEYLLKQYIQTGIKWLEDDYLDSVDDMKRYLFKRTNGIYNYTYVAEMEVYRTLKDMEDVKYLNKMDHLVCFLPGTLALGYYHFSPIASELRLRHNLETPSSRLNRRYDGHLNLAKDLARTCYHMYSDMGTGLSPEIATFVHAQDPNNPLATNQPELQVQSGATHNILRPEFVESLFYMYHITGLPIYRKQGKEIFESFQRYSRITSGYTPISDVREKPSSSADIEDSLHRRAPDRMESFWMSETLKYLYLLFCDDQHIIETLLNHYVFNTEGHPIPVQ